MIRDIVIVGCGTVGSSLAVELVKRNKADQITICDFDTIHKYGDMIYPYSDSERGLLKVDALETILKLIDPHVEVIKIDSKIESPFECGFFVIDCRDSKRQNISATIRISLDGYMLYIDSTKNASDNYGRYIFPKTKELIDKAILSIVDYLQTSSYIFNDFRFYDLRYPIPEVHILKNGG